MKAIIVVEPVRFREVGDDRVDVVFPEAVSKDIEAMQKQIVVLLADPREDVVLTLSFPGSLKVEVTDATRIRDVVGE